MKWLPNENLQRALLEENNRLPRAVTVALRRSDGSLRSKAMDVYEKLLDAGAYGAEEAARAAISRQPGLQRSTRQETDGERIEPKELIERILSLVA